jgi:hypothetical protein
MKASNQQWSNLYEMAIAFKKAEVWNWMDNIHLIGVKHPDFNQVGYCCIMGGGGEMYGVAVYLGADGLKTVIDMLNGQLKEDPLYAQHCLMLSFDDREDLHPQERAQIKELGLKFRGRQAWPTFRLYEPGFYPWPIQKASDVDFLTAAIEQALEVALTYQNNPDALLDSNGKFLTRVAEHRTDGGLSWSSVWLKPELDNIIQEASLPKPLNELRLAKIKKSMQRQGGIWEIGCFYLPRPVLDQDRPYYPLVFMVIDQESGHVLTIELCEKAEIASAAPEKFLELIESIKHIPSELRASDGRVFEYLRQIITAMELEQKCYIYDRLPMLEQARKGMFQHMS